MAKRGPKSKAGARYPCGKLRPETTGPTPELVEHRRALVGGDDKKQRYASYPLGVLYARRLILSGDHYAGQRYAMLYVRGVHPLTLPSVLGNLIGIGAALAPARDADHGAQDRLDYLAARHALNQCSFQAAMAVDDLVIHDHDPTTQRRLDQIRSGLHALHAHFERVDEVKGGVEAEPVAQTHHAFRNGAPLD